MLSLPVMDKLKIAKATAAMLLEIEAVHVNARDPFILTSGAASPVYIDCRKLISFVRIRSALMGFASSVLAEDAGFEAFDSVAGGETAGIPFAAFLAERLALPMQYVRKKPKGFGRNAQIEGDLPDGSNVLLVEDLATDGGSKLLFADALREAGVEVKGLIAIFTYGLPVAQAAFEASPCKWLTLTDYPTMLDQALVEGYLNDDQRSLLDAWNSDPVAWSDAFESK